MSKINLQRGKLTVENRKSREKKPLRGLLLAVSLLGEQRHDGCEQFA